MNQTMAIPTTLERADLDHLAWRPFDAIRGVAHKTLWQDATSSAGLLRIDAGCRLGEHAHGTNHHHLWVLDGAATITGRYMTSGSYVHVPATVRHDIDATGTAGCTVFYVYERRPGDAD